jgi:ferritin-like metal-binding protein YciE
MQVRIIPVPVRGTAQVKAAGMTVEEVVMQIPGMVMAEEHRAPVSPRRIAVQRRKPELRVKHQLANAAAAKSNVSCSGRQLFHMVAGLFSIPKLLRMKNSKSAVPTNGNGAAKSGSSPLEKFFIDQLKDIYYAEQQLTRVLPEMKQAASTEELEDAFENHLKQTERHVKRLEKVFKLIGQKPEGKKCEAMEGLIREAKTIISETKEDSMTRDAALIIAAQKVEHYEIATYGGLVQLAVTMDFHRAAEILDKTLQEEEETDRNLTWIAESFINLEAEKEGPYSWQKKETLQVEEQES